jgi:uncharacterized protein (DUF433 family)
MSDERILEGFPSLVPADLAAAWQFVEKVKSSKKG